MTEFVRIKAENGQEISVPAIYVDAFGVTALGKPAADRFGRPLPTKSPAFRRSAATTSAEAPAEAPARKGSVSKENK